MAGDILTTVDVNSVGSGDSGSLALTIHRGSKMNLHVTSTNLQKIEHWWQEALKRSPVLVTLKTEPYRCFGHVIDWACGVDDVWGAVVWDPSGPLSIEMCARTNPNWLAIVALWHEIGHISTMEPLHVHTLLFEKRRYRQEYQTWAELAAWKWAKQQLGSEWDAEAEAYAHKCLRTYGINNGQVI